MLAHLIPMTKQTGYYVTVIRNGKTGWLLGPIADHEIAKMMVGPIRRIACKIDPFCDFDAFGTASITTEGELPEGKLNEHFDKWS